LLTLYGGACKWRTKDGFLGSGCDQCNGTGFFGRTAIHEFLLLDEELKGQVTRGVPTVELRETAIKRAMRPVREDGLQKVRAGLTTETEIIYVT